jgi:hypothetical protein
MKILRAALVMSAICLFVSCGGSDNGTGTGGTGGSSAGTAGASGASGTAGTTGSAGTTGTGGGGGGGQGSCQACVSCVQANCASQVTACMANTGCNAIYQCAAGCTMDVEACIQMNLAAVQAWATTVSACINQNCLSQCNY